MVAIPIRSNTENHASTYPERYTPIKLNEKAQIIVTPNKYLINKSLIKNEVKFLKNPLRNIDKINDDSILF